MQDGTTGAGAGVAVLVIVAALAGGLVGAGFARTLGDQAASPTDAAAEATREPSRRVASPGTDPAALRTAVATLSRGAARSPGVAPEAAAGPLVAPADLAGQLAALAAARPPRPPFASLRAPSRAAPARGPDGAGMPLVELRKDQGVALLTLDNPPANAYSHEMHRELDAAVLDCRFDESVHVLVLTGAGERFFCAGADIGMLARVTPEWKYNFCLHANETLCRLEQTPKLVIAALNGHCVGGGLEIALAADLRWARQGAGKLGLPEVALGVLPGTGGTARLARAVGRARAIELMARGETFAFERGLELGLVNEVLPAEGFLERVLARAREFCPPGKAARAVGLIKRSVVSGLEMGFHEHLALERELQQRLFTGHDAAEGFAAFNAKRAPRFEGR